MSKCNLYVGYYEVFITPGRIEDFEPPLGIDTDALSFVERFDSVADAMEFADKNYPSADIILDDRLKAEAGYFDDYDIFSRKGRIMSSAKTFAQWDGFKAVESEMNSVLSKFTVGAPSDIYIDSIMERIRDNRGQYVTLGYVWSHHPVKPELLEDYEVDSPAAKVWDMYWSELEMLFGTFESFQAAITSGMWQSVVYDPALGLMGKPESWVLKEAEREYNRLVEEASSDEPDSITIECYFAVRESDFERLTGYIPYKRIHLERVPDILPLLEKEGNTLEVFSACGISGSKHGGDDNVLYDPKAVDEFKPAGTFANPKFDLLEEMRSAGLKVN